MVCYSVATALCDKEPAIDGNLVYLHPGKVVRKPRGSLHAPYFWDVRS